MENMTFNLGQRILDAARIAVAVHLDLESDSSTRGQRVAIGRAGPQVVCGAHGARTTDLSKDGRLPARSGWDGGVESSETSPADAPSRPPLVRRRFAEGSD